jgi:hypothetical protein
MGVKLDWEIENEEAAYNNLGEQARFKRQRHANRTRTLLAVFIVAALIIGVVAAIMGRLWYVDFEIERQLVETVTAEVAALRIGDIAGYLYIQRSESEAWVLGQTDQFWQYQQLKQDHDVQLTGQVLDVIVDENRGRALVEEIIDGQRYQRLWFYWRYEDGWRHVPMDSTFWGDAQQAEGAAGTLLVEYYDLDANLAAALIPGLERLWEGGCRWLGCTTPPEPLTVRIMPDPAVGISWSPDDSNVLRIPSPLTGRARRMW